MSRFRLRNYTPRGLYARTLALLLVPILVILTLMTWYYYSNHISEVNRKLSQSVARDASLIQAQCASSVPNEAEQQLVATRLSISFDCNYEQGFEFPAHETESYFYASVLRDELRYALHSEVRTALDPTTSQLDIRFDAAGKTVQMQIDRKRALAVNSHFFIVWVIVFSLVMLALAIGFLNQQVKSIVQLSKAARSFGRGRDFDFHPSGATEVRDAARSVIDMKNRLVAFTEQRTAMLAGVSHDLRTPLTRLKLTLAMMDDSDDIQAAKADLDDMSAMLDEYLNFASGEDGDAPEELDLTQLVHEIAGSFEQNVDLGALDDATVMARPLGTKRAISNLISNALKFGNVVKVSILNGPKAVDIHIDDDGPGIAPENYEDAFRPFSRLDEARTQNIPGTGLGLTLARDTARSQGGDIILSRSPLGGLRASMRLPH